MKKLNVYKIVGALVCVIVLCLSITLPVLGAEIYEDGDSEPEVISGDSSSSSDVLLDEFGEPIELPPPALFVNGVEAAPNEQKVINLTGSGTYTITTNGVVDASIVISGGEWAFGSDIEITGGITVLQGVLATAGYKFKGESFYVGEYTTTKKCQAVLGSSRIEVFAFAVRGNDVNLNAGGSTIVTTLLYDNSAKAGRVYHNVEINDKTTTTIRVTYVDRIVTYTDIDGTLKSYTVTDKVETPVTNTVYGYIEGVSKFKNLIINGNTYVNNNLTTDDTKVVKGRLIPNKATVTISELVGGTTITVSK